MLDCMFYRRKSAHQGAIIRILMAQPVLLASYSRTHRSKRTSLIDKALKNQSPVTCHAQNFAANPTVNGCEPNGTPTIGAISTREMRRFLAVEEGFRLIAQSPAMMAEVPVIRLNVSMLLSRRGAVPRGSVPTLCSTVSAPTNTPRKPTRSAGRATFQVAVAIDAPLKNRANFA